MKNSQVKHSDFLVLIFSLVLVFWGFRGAQASEQLDVISETNLVGQANMSYLFWDIYDARLFAENGNWSMQSSFALELEYQRELDGKAIAKRSVEEIRGQGYEDEEKLEQWLSAMEQMFPDVDKGTRLTGIVDDSKVTTFYLNDELLGKVEDPDFSEQFFGIWLGEKTSEPKLRKQLLGEK